MNITLKQLEALNACHAGIKWFKAQKNRETKHILRACVKAGKFNYANWYVTKMFTHPQSVKYAIHAAERCLTAYESRYPGDNRPRRAIKAAAKWIQNPTKETRSAAESAARSAARSAAESAAAPAAESARSAAESARSAAESAAASAAESAAWSAAASARSAAWSAEFAESAIIEKAIQILGL